ncbi:MAG: hypothetical protein AB8E15_02180 [Bdellovibrionales bacterium]
MGKVQLEPSIANYISEVLGVRHILLSEESIQIQSGNTQTENSPVEQPTAPKANPIDVHPNSESFHLIDFSTRPIYVFVFDTKDAKPSDEELEFFNKIFVASKIPRNRVSIYSIKENTLNLPIKIEEQIKLSPKSFLLGETTRSLISNVTKELALTEFNYFYDKTIVATHSLGAMTKDPSLKKEVWDSLKALILKK